MFDRVSFFLHNIKRVDARKTDNFSCHFAWGVFDDFAFDGFAIEKMIVVCSDFFAGFADFVSERAPECVVVFAE